MRAGLQNRTRLAHFVNGTPILRARYTDQVFDRHTHDTFLVGVNLSGAHRSYLKGGDILVPAHSIVLINPGEVHSGSKSSTEDWSYVGLYPSPSLMEDLFDERDPIFFPDPVIEDTELEGALCRAQRRAFASDRLISEEGLLDFLATLVRRYAEGKPRLAAPVGAPGLRSARQLIEDRYLEKLTLSEIAAAADLSRYHVLRSFRSAFGLTPHEYQMDLRIRRAQQLLAQGSFPSAVAYETGFADQSHLTRRFKRHLGVTPGQYRQDVN